MARRSNSCYRVVFNVQDLYPQFDSIQTYGSANNRIPFGFHIPTAPPLGHWLEEELFFGWLVCRTVRGSSPLLPNIGYALIPQISINTSLQDSRACGSVVER